MNSGSFSGVVAVASTVSDTSKVLGSNWRVATLTLRVSCGCFCSIRLCGARGFSKLRSLMYWPWMVSGLGACCGCWGCGLGPPGGGVDMAYFLSEGGRYHAGQGCTSRGGAAIANRIARRDDISMKSTRLRPLIGVSACLKENGRGGWVHSVGDKYVQ